MEKQRKTFLSYSRANKDFAIRLAKELKSEGFAIWLDQLDIPLGARWDVEVERALEESEIFMIIMTPASTSSENVRDEIGYAIDNGKRFLPVLLENCTVPLRLRRFQYVDFTNKNFDDGVESAKELLRSLTDQPTIPRMEVPADAQSQPEMDLQAREAVERLAVQKVEEAPLTKQNAEAAKLAKRKSDEELAAKAKTDREAKEKVTPAQAMPVQMKVETVSAVPKKKQGSKGLVIGAIAGVIFVICAIASFGIRAFLNSPVTPVATEPPAAEINGFNVNLVQYSEGQFFQTDAQSWMETKTTNSDEVYYYVETGRDEWSVYLYDESRNWSIHLDLYEKQISVDTNEGNGEVPIFSIDSAAVQ
jgi:hypothetical protein